MRVGVDIGGTFTDFVGMGKDGQVFLSKESTTPKELTEAILRCFARVGLHKLADVNQILHGSTVAINTIIQQVGAKTALITTKGMRDVYEIGRSNRPDSWNLFFHRPRPLVTREWRLEVSERITAKGDILVPLDESGLAETVDLLKREAIEAVAVCFLHSYVNPVHEQRVGEILRKELPGVFVTVSHELIREMREYERTSTAVLNAYVGPVVASYLDKLEKRVKEQEFKGVLLIMQSNGGCMSTELARRQPILTTESGPVSGIIGAAHLTEVMDLDAAIAFDMGGTTAKTAFIRNGTVPLAPGCYIGGYETGQPMRVPVVDIIEIGAGGGSIAWLDEVGVLNVGPKSAGADPGPVCYGKGGHEPTVTDANLLLGRLNPANFLGGEMPLAEDPARAALKSRIADPKRLKLHEAADAILQIVTSNMSLAVRRISVEKGIDPRDCVIIAFGGAGPLHAVGVAKELSIPRVIIPPMPGHFSALGMLVADLRHDYVQTFLHDLQSADMKVMHSCLQQFEDHARTTLMSEGAHPDSLSSALSQELRYQGQDHVLSVPVTFEELKVGDYRAFVDRYDRLHQEYYGHAAPGETVEVVNLRLIAAGRSRGTRAEVFLPISKRRKSPEVGWRQVYWGSVWGWRNTAIYRREQLSPGFEMEGPAIVEEKASTTAVYPGGGLRVDPIGTLTVEVA